MTATLAAELAAALAGALWTVIFWFVKRTLDAIEKKLEENRKQSESAARQLERLGRELEARHGGLQADLLRTLAARRAACQRHYVSRQEFGAFTATINHKIDCIYELLKTEERTTGR